MPFADIRNQRFYYQDSGTGPAIVFSHGFLMDHSMFTAQVAELSADHRVVAWDWRGFGQTETDGQPFTIWDQVDDLLALLDYLGIDQAVFAGMSHGGYITMRVPLVAPDRARAIILMDTNSAGLGPHEQVSYRQMFDRWMTDGPTDELCDTFGHIIIGDPRLNAEWKRRWQARPKDQMRHAVTVTIELDDLRPRLPEIGCPAVVLHGVDDLAFSTERAEDTARLIPGAGDPVFVPGGHAACMSHSQETNRAIRDFLAGL
ncbi:MAG TPA: alpha/beta hydrolase [Pseudonocardia sp.]|jgi:pimeloyl-ACP methyl ester carboxylesterase